jgi:hypothetical protein
MKFSASNRCTSGAAVLLVAGLEFLDFLAKANHGNGECAVLPTLTTFGLYQGTTFSRAVKAPTKLALAQSRRDV